MMKTPPMNRSAISVAPALTVCFVTSGRVSSQSGQQQASPTRTKIDLSKLGPQVGDRVPDFALKDQSGQTRTLQSIMGPKGAMLVFIRSADW
jgi:hypothetical protein